jgi:PTH1 family peptidyl-tRNA hydrolase
VAVDNRRCRALTGRTRIGPEEVILAKPETYMNLSGLAVRELVAEMDIEPQTGVIVIYDELDFPLGTVRVRERGSSAGHKGIETILNALGTEDFLRIRLGIAPDYQVRDNVRYVLSPIKKAQYELVDEVLDTAADAVETIIRDGSAAAMNRFNQRLKQ